MGGARFDIPCIAQKAPTIASTQLPPTPKPSTTTTDTTLPYLSETSTSLLTPIQIQKLREFAAARQLQIQNNATKEEAAELIRPAITWMHQ